MLKTWSHHFHFGQEPRLQSGESVGFVYYLGEQKQDKIFHKVIKEQALHWQKKQIEDSKKEFIYFVGIHGPVWLIRPYMRATQNDTHGGLMQESLGTWIRDNVGTLVSVFRSLHLKKVLFYLHEVQDFEELKILFSLEVASYSYRQAIEAKEFQDLPQMYLIKEAKKSFNKEILKAAQAEAQALNIARHLVNLPPNELNPDTFTKKVLAYKWGSQMKVDVWNTQKLKKENMGLLLAVGQGSATPPVLIHLKYRPTQKGKHKKRPVAFVGKGVTFDTGGLDIKPSSAMRLMKKDMGGSAAVFALATWVQNSHYPYPCDFYLCLAENAVSLNSFRPSDVVTARNGLKIEIDNTDAEGRLVMADGLDVAVTSQEPPEMVIDVATLTGAIKVALGAEVAGLFSNHDALAEELTKAGQRAGDLNWRMPLVDKYFASLSSSFADFKNSTEGFGGAITAALFLQKFVKATPWAHLDIYAWNDKAQGPLSFTGGNGQGVQCLIEWLKSRK